MNPPRIPLRLLRAFCPDGLREGIEGDLIEKFDEDVERLGVRAARQRFVWNVVLFFRSGILLRNKFSHPFIDTIMLRSYITVAFRNLLKNKTFSAINVVGLGTGLAACLLIFQFVTFETSYDTFNEKFDRIYRVTNDRFQNGKLIQHGTIMYPTIGPVMAKDYPEIEMYTRVMPGGEINVKAENRYFRGDAVLFADEYFLSVFSYELLAGKAQDALRAPYSVVLTEEIAIKYFGVAGRDFQSVIGKILYWGFDQQPYTVTAVLKNLPDNSHLKFDVFVSYNTLIRPDSHDADDSWQWSDMRHYLVLRKGADYKELESKFPGFSDRYFKGNQVSGSVEKFYLQPLRDAHLFSDYEYDIARLASGKAVWAMLIVSFFILLIAWINYINLTTSRSLERAREVGLRKVMGAFRMQLVKQFLFESVLISMLAVVTAVLLVLLFQEPFNELIGAHFSIWGFISGLRPSMVFGSLAVLVTGIVLAGFYPAFVLSSYQPVTVLRGKFQRSSGGHMLRKGLVVFQFMASAALITGSLIVGEQLRFMRTVELGVNLRNTLVVEAPERTPWDSTFIDRVESYKHALVQTPHVIQASMSNSLPGQRLGRNFGLRLAEQPSDAKYTMSFMGVDYSFFDTYGIRLVAGRKFLATDHNPDFKRINSIILNEKAVALLGIPKSGDIIGKELVRGDNHWRIIGVVGDFHQESLKNQMEPMLFLPVYSNNGSISVKIDNTDVPGTISRVEELYKKYFPDNAFEYSFMQDRYDHQYDDDKRFGRVISIFTVLALIISSLGLVALSSYTALQRTKEIGIRKVMGATLPSIVRLLCIDFLKLVLLAAVLALPAAWFPMRSWLQSYAYHIPMNALLFAIPVVAIVLVAFLTMSFQVLKTARVNPATTLKYE